VNLSTNFATLDYIVYQDLGAGVYPMRFYRAVPIGSGPGGAIESLAVLAGGFITFNYPSIPGHTYVLQSTTNLTYWSDLSTSVSEALSLSFTNLTAPGYPERFFRVLEQP
jgi:hypothetical protein